MSVFLGDFRSSFNLFATAEKSFRGRAGDVILATLVYSNHTAPLASSGRSYFGHVQETPQIANITTEWVPLHHLLVPTAMSEVDDTPHVSPSRRFVFPVFPPSSIVFAQPPVSSDLSRVLVAPWAASVPLHDFSGLWSVPPSPIPSS